MTVLLMWSLALLPCCNGVQHFKCLKLSSTTRRLVNSLSAGCLAPGCCKHHVLKAPALCKQLQLQSQSQELGSAVMCRIQNLRKLQACGGATTETHVKQTIKHL
jgi:hypothetical protein